MQIIDLWFSPPFFFTFILLISNSLFTLQEFIVLSHLSLYANFRLLYLATIWSNTLESLSSLISRTCQLLLQALYPLIRRITLSSYFIYMIFVQFAVVATYLASLVDNNAKYLSSQHVDINNFSFSLYHLTCDWSII